MIHIIAIINSVSRHLDMLEASSDAVAGHCVQ